MQIYKNRKTNIAVLLFVTILPALFLIIFQSCSNVNDQNIPTYNNSVGKSNLLKTKPEIMQDIKTIAKCLALTLKDKQYRQILESEIKASINVENILEASKFLNDTRKVNKKGELISVTFNDEIASKLETKDAISMKGKIKNLEYGLIDIYFPVKEHREKWCSENELLVGVADDDLAKEKGIVLAYDLNGNEVYLSAKQVPSTPTLIVTKSEKNKNYKELRNKGVIDNLKRSASILSTTNEVETPLTNLTFTIEGYRMSKNYEGWFDGDNDIFFKYGIKYDSQPGVIYFGRTLVNSIELNNWKWCGYQIISNSNSNFTIELEMWEEDAFSNDLVADKNWNNNWSFARTNPNHTFEVSYIMRVPELSSIRQTMYTAYGENHWELGDGFDTNDIDQVQVLWDNHGIPY